MARAILHEPHSPIIRSLRLETNLLHCPLGIALENFTLLARSPSDRRGRSISTMPSFSTEVNHNLGREGAKERLQNFLDRARKVYKDQVSDLSGEWSGDILNFVMTTYGFKINGELVVEEALVRLSGQLPFAAVAFRGKI